MASTTQLCNALGQPVGFPVNDWQTPSLPSVAGLQGRYCCVEKLDADTHGIELFNAFMKDTDEANWTYLPYGPFATQAGFQEWLSSVAGTTDPFFHVIIDSRTGKAVGVASYLRIDPANATIEVGHIHFSPLMQRQPVATECMYLMMKRVFEELGYRRYEWKCDSLNQPSCRAAQRLGFSYEGLFRQATMYKGRNRDTAWYSVIDSEWPRLKTAFEQWLAPGNFQQSGQQIASLASFRQ